ncbi:MAG: hypothetical protein RR552_08100 [Oscillospiraceae bacterium]
MATSIAIKSILELAAVLLLIYGFYKEDKVIAFEQKVKMIVVVNYRRYKKRKRHEQLLKEQHLMVYEGGKNKPTKRGTYHVA